MGEKLNILIVDDEEDICLMVSRILQKEGHSVTFCHSIQEGKGYVLNNRYQAYFLDLNLTDGSGFDLIPLIQGKNEGASQIIIISAYDGHLERERAESFGVDAFIHKPFTKRQILEALSRNNQ